MKFRRLYFCTLAIPYRRISEFAYSNRSANFSTSFSRKRYIRYCWRIAWKVSELAGPAPNRTIPKIWYRACPEWNCYEHNHNQRQSAWTLGAPHIIRYSVYTNLCYLLNIECNLITHNDSKENGNSRADQSPPTAQKAHKECDTQGNKPGCISIVTTGL